MTTTTVSPVDQYLDLPYHIRLTPDRDEHGKAGYVAEIEELEGCVSQGETPTEAVESVRDAMAGWISVALEDGRDIPEPRLRTEYSGKFVARLPKSLHAEVARASDAEGVSLNQFVSSALAAAVGWRIRNR
jgi:antitoxin HicB